MHGCSTTVQRLAMSVIMVFKIITLLEKTSENVPKPYTKLVELKINVLRAGGSTHKPGWLKCSKCYIIKVSEQSVRAQKS